MKLIFRTFAVVCMAGIIISCIGKNRSKQVTSDNVMQSSNFNDGENSGDLSGDDSVGLPIKWGDNDVAAIAFIGYYSDTEKALEVAKSEYGYDARTVEMEGDECYIIIPRKPEAVIEVRHYSYDIVTNREIVGESVYAANEAPVLLRCNISDIQSNSQVTVTLNDKKVVFDPKLNLQDGTINLSGVTPAGKGTVVDITKYKQQMGEANEQSVVYDCDPMNEIAPEALLKNGSVTVHIKLEDMQKILSRNGQNPDMACEGRYDVEGLDGICEKIFFGNWGQDVNPLLCMLMDDGRVEILDINNAVLYYDFASSGRLPNLNNIVSFKQVGDEGGTYVVAVDRDGKEHDIEMFLGTGGILYYYEDLRGGTLVHLLRLTPDWKIDFGTVAGGEDYYDRSIGRFRQETISGESGEATYSYHFTVKLCEDPNSDTGYSLQETDEKGSFSMRGVENEGMGREYELKVKSGKLVFARVSDAPRFSNRKREY